MASSASSSRKAFAQPYAMELSLAMPMTRAFLPCRTGRGVWSVMVEVSLRNRYGGRVVASLRERVACVARDHELFVGRHDPCRHAAAVAADARPALGVGDRVD